MTKTAKHRGRFNWRTHTKYSGNLRDWWTDPRRPEHTRHRRYEDLADLPLEVVYAPED
jgi:hypothetical protein